MIDSVRKIRQRTIGLVDRHVLGVAAAFAAKATGAGLLFLFSILLARLLGAAGTGLYFLALTMVSIGATITRLGLDNAVLRFGAVADAQGDRPTLAALYRQSIGLTVVAGTAVTVFIWLVAPYIPLGGDRSTELHAILRVMLFAIIPAALVMLYGEFFKATGAPGMATSVQDVVLPIFLLIGAAFLFWRGIASLDNIAFLYLASAIATVLFAGAAWSQRRPRLWKEKGHFDTRLLLRTSLPLLWVASMNLIMSWTDILVLGLWADPVTVGVYGIAARVAALTTFILIAVNSVTAPRFAALFAQGDHKALERLAQRSTVRMVLAASPIILLLLLLPAWVLQLFGSDFVWGSPLLRVLALGQMVNVSTGSVGYLLMMTGHERLMRNTIVLSAFLNLLGNLVLVPVYGGMGAAVSTAFSLAFMNLLSFVLVNKKLGINTMGYLFGRNYPCGNP